MRLTYMTLDGPPRPSGNWVMCSMNFPCVRNLEDGLWVLLLDDLRDLGPGGQYSGYFPAPPHKPYVGQRRGRDPQPVPRGWADAAIDFSIFEPAGTHPEEDRGREDHGEVQEAQSKQQAQPAAHPQRGCRPSAVMLRRRLWQA